MSAPLTCTPLSPVFGVAVENYDFLWQPDAEQSEALRSLLWKHHVLLFPRVQIDAEQQRWLLGVFGAVADEFGKGQYYSIERSNKSPDGDEGSELSYHADFGFTSRPLEVISLYGMEIPQGSAGTGFASGVRACRQLPPSLRARLQGKFVLHASDVTSEHPQSAGRLNPEDLSTKQYTGAIYPAIFPHPKTGEEILFFNEYMSIKFEGLSREESDTLLAETLAHLYKPEHIYEHSWRQGDLIIFDNIALSHNRGKGVARTLRRVVVGESPFLSVLPASMGSVGAIPLRN